METVRKSNKHFKLYSINECPNIDDIIRKFNSDNDKIDNFFKEKIIDFEKDRRLKTFVLLDCSKNTIVGFFSSTVGKLEGTVKNDDGTESIAYPYINLAYFAVDRNYQSKGIGRALMMQFFSMCMVISLYTGITLVYLESVDTSTSFYTKLGYNFVDKKLTPEIYERNGIDTRNLKFPMIRYISDLAKGGHIPYSAHVLPIDVIH